jgi:hypothetical protein
MKEIVVAYFGVISENSPGGTEKVHGKSQSGYSVAEPKIRTRILRNSSHNITASADLRPKNKNISCFN